MISPLEGGSRRRDRRRRKLRRRLARALVVLLPVAGVVSAWFLLSDNGGTIGGGAAAPAGSGAAVKSAKPPAAAPTTPGAREAVALEAPDVFQLHFKQPPRAAIAFDVKSGRVLWRLNPLQPMPIASITKLMTALLVAENTRNSDL